MSQQRRIERNAHSYARRPPTRPVSGKSILVVTEGEKSEPGYLNLLKGRLELTHADVEVVHPEGTDPVTLVMEAVRLRNIRKQEFSRWYEFGKRTA